MGNGVSSRSSSKSINSIQKLVPPNSSEMDFPTRTGSKIKVGDPDDRMSICSTCVGEDLTRPTTCNSTYPLPGSPDADDSDDLDVGVTTRATGEAGTFSYSLIFTDASGRDISPWHDIPLHTGVDQVCNMIVEIPKMTKAKFEVATKLPQNPIKQDIKKGKLREYHGPIFWNYGMFPQTWEDPNVEHPTMKCCGDNDPLDVVEIGANAHKCGSVVPVKVLGALAMLDEGEVDWKTIAICTSDPLAAVLHDIADVEELCPGMVSGIREWFRWYKTPDGKSLNAFGYEGKALGREEALSIVEETHQSWTQLRAGAGSSIDLWMN